jgi:hypothetical protein
MTSARLCTEDQDGTEPTSASASRITSGGASMTTSRDACTATTSKLATQPRSRTGLRSYAADQNDSPLRGVTRLLWGLCSGWVGPTT